MSADTGIEVSGAETLFSSGTGGLSETMEVLEPISAVLVTMPPPPAMTAA